MGFPFPPYKNAGRDAPHKLRLTVSSEVRFPQGTLFPRASAAAAAGAAIAVTVTLSFMVPPQGSNGQGNPAVLHLKDKIPRSLADYGERAVHHKARLRQVLPDLVLSSDPPNGDGFACFAIERGIIGNSSPRFLGASNF